MTAWEPIENKKIRSPLTILVWILILASYNLLLSVRQRRLRYLGHLLRLPRDSVVRITLMAMAGGGNRYPERSPFVDCQDSELKDHETHQHMWHWSTNTCGIGPPTHVALAQQLECNWPNNTCIIGPPIHVSLGLEVAEWASLCRLDLERTGSVGEPLTDCAQEWAVRKQ